MRFLNKIQRITLYLFFFSINFEVLRPIADNENLSVSRIFGLLYFLSISPQLPFFLKLEGIKHFLAPIALFFGFFTLMELININEFSSNYIDFSILINLIFFWIMMNHEKKDYMILEKAMLFFALGTIVLVIFYNLGIGVSYQDHRLSMFGDDQNYIGSRTSIGIIILVLAVVQNRLKLGWYRYLFLLPIPLMINLLFETGSRLGFISFVLLIGAGMVLYKTKNIRGKIIVLLFGAVSLILAGIILLQSENMVKRLQSTAEKGDTAGRTEIWQAIFPIVQENPIFGVGHNGYVYHSTLIYGSEVSAHNVILEILCYTGIIGLVIYFVFLFRIGITSYFVYKKHNLLLPLLLLIPVAGMILSIQILAKKVGWIIFAYIVSSLAEKHNEQRTKNQNS